MITIFWFPRKKKASTWQIFCTWYFLHHHLPFRGGVLTLTWYTYMCLPFGAPFRKIWYSDRGFSSETKEPKLHKLGVFWANYCKKHPIWSKLGAFLPKMVYWWVGNLAKNWYRDSQIFEVRQAHPRTILVKEPPRATIAPNARVNPNFKMTLDTSHNACLTLK